MARSDETRKAILDAAEKLFSQAGFHGVSMRSIAVEAGVPQGLLHYHFVNKEGLFEAVFARRVVPLVEQRLALLRRCLSEASGAQPRLEEILEAFFRPLLDLGHEEAGVHYSRLIALVVNATDPRSRALTRRYFDGMAREYVAALRQAVPGLAADDAFWGYFFIMGAGIVSIARSGRIEDLSGRLCRSDDPDAVLARVVPYCAAGLRALAGAGCERARPVAPSTVESPVDEPSANESTVTELRTRRKRHA